MRAFDLLDADGTRWKVVEASVEQGRLWVTARRPASNGNGRSSDSPPRIFDTTLRNGVRLVWRDPEGRRVTVKGAGGGAIFWEARDEAGSQHETGKLPREALSEILATTRSGS